MKLLIHAPNVHQGGGRTLLLALLTAGRERADISAVIDARLQIPPDLAESRIVARVAPTVRARLAAEWRLRSRLTQSDVLLCFGNLPPLFGASGRIVLFLQNRYLVRRRSVPDLPPRARLRIEIERMWLRARLVDVDRVVVQSESMAREVQEELRLEPVVLPYVAAAQACAPQRAEERFEARDNAVFLYVASGEAHKNHRNLLSAWKLLAQQDIHPSLCLTISRVEHPVLCAQIEEEKSKYGLMINNVGPVQHSTVKELYGRCSALIYPSEFESFGLPLLEARSRGLPIVAAELDYVRDLADPVETFDPESPVSIARAVKRFLGRAETRRPILTPDQFVDALLAGMEIRQ